jgi:hypothetical protein
LAAFNDLRHCALPSLRAPLAARLYECVARAAAALIRVDATHRDLTVRSSTHLTKSYK